jgi:RNA polymerase sigma-70 factor (ECF subfamily)
VEQIDKILLDCQRGNQKAQRQLFDALKVEMLSLCRRYCVDEATAKDIFQEGFVRIFKDMYQFDPSKGKFRSWARKVMVNSALMHIRANKKWTGYLELNGVPSEDLSYTDETLESLSAKELYALMKKMPEGYRVVFNMYVIEGYTHQEISEYMGSTVGTSKSQLHKAKQWLRERLLKIDPSTETRYARRFAQG